MFCHAGALIRRRDALPRPRLPVAGASAIALGTIRGGAVVRFTGGKAVSLPALSLLLVVALSCALLLSLLAALVACVAFVAALLLLLRLPLLLCPLQQ